MVSILTDRAAHGSGLPKNSGPGPGPAPPRRVSGYPNSQTGNGFSSLITRVDNTMGSGSSSTLESAVDSGAGGTRAGRGRRARWIRGPQRHTAPERPSECASEMTENISFNTSTWHVNQLLCLRVIDHDCEVPKPRVLSATEAVCTCASPERCHSFPLISSIRAAKLMVLWLR